jgi:hypothetical protein
LKISGFAPGIESFFGADQRRVRRYRCRRLSGYSREGSRVFEKALGYSDIWEYARRTGHAPETEGSTHQPILDHNEPSRPWSDRKLFREILKRYRLLPITVDSHIGEYIPWARDTADHQGIRDFYEFYRRALSTAERDGYR